MVLTIKHKHILYRKYEKDIWGFCHTSPDVYLNIIKNNDKKNKKSIYLDFKYYYHEFFFKLFCEEKQFSYYKKRRLIYKFEAPKFYNKGRKLNKRFISLRLTRLYFLTYKDCQFRKLFRKAAKMNGQFQLNYLKFLECRILSVLYRFNFHYDIFFLLKLIRKGNNVFINFNLVNHPNKILLVGDFLTISKKFHAKFRSIWIRRLKKEKYYTFFLPSAFVSFEFFFAYLMREPRKNEFIYPFAIDVQRISGYY